MGNEAERVAKVVEKSLAADVPISVQDACLRGLLYLSEDIGSQVLPLVGPTLTKYIPSHLQLCSRSVILTGSAMSGWGYYDC